MEQMLERLVNTYVKNPQAFPLGTVLVPACLLLAEQGFKLSGMSDKAVTLLRCAQCVYQRDTHRYMSFHTAQTAPLQQHVHASKQWSMLVARCLGL